MVSRYLVCILNKLYDQYTVIYMNVSVEVKIFGSSNGASFDKKIIIYHW